MVAHVLRLRADLLLGALRGEPGHVVRMLVALVAGAAALVVACWAMMSLGGVSDEGAGVVTVFAGSAVTLGFALAPLMIGTSDPLDPRRFSLLGMRPMSLAGATALAGVVSVPAISLIAFSVSSGFMWADHGAAPLWRVLSVVLTVATCVLLARVSLAVATLVVRDRRSRELTGVFLVGLVVVVLPVVVFLASLEWEGSVPMQLSEAAAILALTPIGAAWALPAASVSGDAVGITLCIAAATVVILAALWAWLVHRLLTTTERPVVLREKGGLGWFTVAPATPGGAVAARSVIYWSGDRRYAVDVLIVPIAALLTTIPLLVAGVPTPIVALVPLPIIALFFGWLPHNDLAYDSTAVWMHVASGMRGASDRIGRLTPMLFVGIPTLAVGVPLAVALYGRWALLPAVLGVCGCLFLSGLGLSSISSVTSPYAVSRPGDSPFQQPQRAGGAGMLGQVLVMGGAVAFSLPALWFAWLALTVDIDNAIPALWAGAGVGVVVLVAGILVGGAAFDRRSGRIMEFVEST